MEQFDSGNNLGVDNFPEVPVGSSPMSSSDSETLRTGQDDDARRLEEARIFEQGPPGFIQNKREDKGYTERRSIELLLQKAGIQIPEGYEPMINGDAGFIFDEQPTELFAGKLRDQDSGEDYLLKRTIAVPRGVELGLQQIVTNQGNIPEQSQDAIVQISQEKNQSRFESVNGYLLSYYYDDRGEERARASESPSITVKSIYTRPKGNEAFEFPEQAFITVLIEDNGNKVTELKPGAVEFWKNKIKPRSRD